MAIEITRGFVMNGNRYMYDFGDLTTAKGWAQVDTRQDASYYGTWTNPGLREIFSYCEGDTTLTRCDTDEEYKQELARVVEWHKDAGYWIGIDPGLNEELKQKFVALGLAEYFHQSMREEQSK